MKSRKGFTLIEVLIVVSLVAVVGLLMYSFFGQGFNLYAVESQSADEQTNIRMVLSDITNKARLTDPATITCVSGVLNIGSYAYKLDGGKVTRNGAAIANGITTFTASKTSGILEIKLVNTSGKSISTSVSLNRGEI
jgi:prepilin-type N-terminal cleavage/methylation domain-containing protein